ncbi:hypothetical protein ABIB57_005362 [Devosia sp. UYZn731]|uniref:hypothetical protein n=1 Tax=Devosia sp. UYZn731 TaxID=3156345 RepID=UPI003391215E
MTKRFQVVDCRTELNAFAEIGVMADTPEHAARLVLGEHLVRGSPNPAELRARVYFQGGGGLTMVRLYCRIEQQESRI